MESTSQALCYFDTNSSLTSYLWSMTMMTDLHLEPIAQALRQARRVVVMTGAGMSAQSGIPTFRDPMTGLWAKFKPGELATPEAFARDPALVTRWYDERRLGALGCAPNAGHVALAQLERAIVARGGAMTLLTQNVDGLHQRAGSAHVVEVHGSILRWRDARTGASELLMQPEALGSYPPPSRAGGVLRPDVVWFGEALPEDAIATALEDSQACDVYVAIGTSGVVYPAAGFSELAARAGATLVEVNPGETPLSARFTYTLRGSAAQVLPALVAQVLDAQ